MNSAAVGFQCPSCVREGARTTRQARTRFGGLRAGRPGVVSSILIGINALVWVAIMASGGAGSRLLDYLALQPRGYCLATAHPGNIYPHLNSASLCARAADGSYVPGVADGRWWELLTSMFTHVEVWHIGFNMLALWVLGPQLEAALGRLRFTALYLLSGLVGSALVYWLSSPETPTLGASGAIFGLMGGLLVLALRMKADVQQLLMWIGINAVITVAGSSISWQGHLGGFVGGVVLGGVLAYAPRERRTTWQVAGFGVVAIAVVVAVLLRTIALSGP